MNDQSTTVGFRHDGTPVEAAAPSWFDRFMAPGVTLLSAPVRTGMSRLACSLAIAVATGEEFLGVLMEEAADALIVDLESTDAEALQRVLSLTKEPPNRLLLARFPRLDNGFARCLRREAAACDDLRLVVLDDLSSALPEDADEVTADAELTALDDLARLLDVCVLVLKKLPADSAPFSFAPDDAPPTVYRVAQLRKNRSGASLFMPNPAGGTDRVDFEFDKSRGTWKLDSGKAAADRAIAEEHTRLCQVAKASPLAPAWEVVITKARNAWSRCKMHDRDRENITNELRLFLALVEAADGIARVAERTKMDNEYFAADLFVRFHEEWSTDPRVRFSSSMAEQRLRAPLRHGPGVRRGARAGGPVRVPVPQAEGVGGGDEAFRLRQACACRRVVVCCLPLPVV